MGVVRRYSHRSTQRGANMKSTPMQRLRKVDFDLDLMSTLDKEVSTEFDMLTYIDFNILLTMEPDVNFMEYRTSLNL